MQSVHILLVDDEKDLIDTLGTRLDMRGIQVTLAYSGQEALDCLQTCCPDIIASDVFMPEMTGYTLLERVNALYPHIPVILLTGHAIEDAQSTSITQKAYACLSKPVAFSLLLETIHAAVQQNLCRK